MTQTKLPHQWRAGQSGNPRGRPPGQSEITKLRKSIMGDAPEILAGLVAAAKAGDVQAARLILERVLPPVKPVEQAIALDLTGDSLTAKASAVLSAVSAGNLAPGQGSQLITAISQLARVSEIDELTARITALEERKNAKS